VRVITKQELTAKNVIIALLVHAISGLSLLLALNILFDLGLPYGLKSIAAATLLSIFFR
jgi:hypothetical protein